MAVDLVTVEVLVALERAEIDALLLKGASFASWLYPDGIRTYLDSDLLVAPGAVPPAEVTLAALGFEHEPLDDLPGDRPWHAHAWIRRKDGAVVDLHRTLIGLTAEPAEVWEVLSERVTTLELRGSTVPVLDLGARLLHVVLHAAQDGRRLIKPLRDLERAVDRAEISLWRDAANLAVHLGGTAAFVEGALLDPRGAPILDRLELHPERSVEARLRASGYTPTALGFQWLQEAPGWRGKARLLLSKAFPSAEFLRAWSPLARRGRLGLLLARFQRLGWLLRHAPAGLLKWWRATRTRT